MHTHDHHTELLNEFFEEQKTIFDHSSQSVYAFLEDGSIVCNQKFATLLGYATPGEWAKVPKTFTEAFVTPKSQKTLVTAYQNSMEKMVGSTIEVTWNKKSGVAVDTTVIVVPIAYKGHLFALHFITEK